MLVRPSFRGPFRVVNQARISDLVAYPVRCSGFVMHDTVHSMDWMLSTDAMDGTGPT
jgi:hypothetical protein